MRCPPPQQKWGFMNNAPPPRKAPNSKWALIGVHPGFTAYQRKYMCALSSIAFIRDKHQPSHWEWIVSFSNMGQQRLSNSEIAICLKDFGIEDFLEDNHEPGIARKFWQAVEERYRKPCPCKDETLITEGDYQYSVKKETAS